MTVLTARIGDIVVSRSPDLLEALALGSCVAVAIYDPVTKIGALCHILLPESNQFKTIDRVGKYADTAIKESIRLAVNKGANRERLRAKMAGGAKMFEIASSKLSSVDVGSRNIASAKKYLKENDIPLIAEDTGGNYGRTVSFNLETSVYTIRIGLKKLERHI